MFDFAPDLSFEAVRSEPINPDTLEARLAGLTDTELASLEDDLDFCKFTGVPSARVLDVLKDMTDLDAGWQEIHAKGLNPGIPAAY